MTIGVGSTLFLDTNVLVYANVVETPLHSVALQAIATHYQAGADLWISRQIMREFIATLTRPQNYANPQPVSTIITRIQDFQQLFNVAEDNADVTAHLLTLLQQIPTGGKQVHDANIVATMQTYGITHILTHNVKDFVRFQPLITIVPL